MMMRAMRRRTIRLAFAGLALAVLPAACSLLYENYPDHFASGDAASEFHDVGTTTPDASSDAFVVEEASITHVTVTDSGVFYSVGDQILSVSLSGTDRQVAWTSATGESVVALVGNGTSELGWTSGELVGADTVFVADASIPAPAASVAQGETLGVEVAADPTSFVWSSSPVAAGGSAIVTLLKILAWRPGAAPSAVSVEAPVMPGGVGANAVALSENSIYAIVERIGLVRFDRADLQEKCTTSELGLGSFTQIAAAPDDSFVYVVSSGTSKTSGTLESYKLSDSGCPSSSEGTTLGSSVSLVTADASGVYWVSSGGEVSRGFFSGQTTHTLSPAGPGPTGIALDSRYVYVAAGNALYRVKKGPDS
jgi:hypothetical protein